MADEQRFRVEPENIPGFGGSGRSDCAECWNAQGSAGRTVKPRFRHTIRLAGAHQDQAEIGGERSVMGVNGVEGKFSRGSEFDQLRASGLKFAAQGLVLRLSLGEVGRMMK